MTISAERIKLTCKSGHISDHLLDRVLRHNDAWCDRCGADLPYVSTAAAPDESISGGKGRSTPSLKLRIAATGPAS